MAYDDLIIKLGSLLEEWGGRVRQQAVPVVEIQPRRGGRPSIVHADQTSVELGRPGMASANSVLWTHHRSHIEAGRLTVMGPELAAGGAYPFGQFVLLAVDEAVAPDPFSLERAQYLANRLAGYMVRMAPGRLWVRISRELKAGGFDLLQLGGALVSAYHADFPYVRAVEIILATDEKAVAQLSAVAAAASLIAGSKKKLVLTADGSYDCLEADCERCDDQIVCDTAREAIAVRNKRRRENDRLEARRA